jgi:tRNA nucleotidyltransferase (CCA-adding enzyme)
MGFQPGPLYKRILDALLEARLNNQVNSKEDELLFVKEKYGTALPA